MRNKQCKLYFWDTWDADHVLNGFSFLFYCNHIEVGKFTSALALPF